MKEKISHNLLINLVLTLGIGILNFVVNKYFVDNVGVETLGLMKLFTQMIAYLSLAELGIGSASAYALYKPLVEKNINQINIVISTIEYFYRKITQIIILLGVLLSFSIPYFIKMDSYSKEVYLYWILYVINTALTYSFAKYTILFTANQEYGYVRKVQGVGRIILQILQIFVLIK
ncbi:MAG: lipopolysaccharide biosynthesis protein, partial [Cetobacterium sp.]